MKCSHLEMRCRYNSMANSDTVGAIIIIDRFYIFFLLGFGLNVLTKQMAD